MFKHILLPATGETADATVFETALAFAEGAGTHLEFLHARPDPAASAITMAGGGLDGGYGLALLIETIEKESIAAEAAARAAWADFCRAHHLATGAQAGALTTELVVEVGEAATCLVEHGRTADLVVMGRHHGNEAVDLGRLQDVLGGIGRPLLITAATCPAKPLDTVVIAWKDSAAAARAVAVAMPFIARAGRVLVLTVGEEGATPASETESASRARLVALLSRHARQAEALQVPLHDGTAVEALMAAAVAAGAGLLIMGGYGHGQLRETVFGGFTQSVLLSAPIPVLMIH